MMRSGMVDSGHSSLGNARRSMSFADNFRLYFHVREIITSTLNSILNMKILINAAIILFVATGYAQTTVPFTSGEWAFKTKDYVLEDYQGKPSLFLKKNTAFLRTASFENGIIEYDVAFPRGRAFIGVTFRMADDDNHEEFYIRTHQSGNPDANQYTPVYGGLAAWQLYYGEGYGAPVSYNYDSWMHVKLVVSGKYMEVYLNDMENPVMFSELKRPVQKGYLGLGNFMSENHFANFTYTPLENVILKGKPKTPEPPATGTITQWQISNPVSEKSLEAVTSLKSIEKVAISWKAAHTESTGVLNLASVVTWSQENNTVFAKVIVDSDKEQVKKFVFGFSDRARVYLNDVLLYSGEDNFLSRDYRFLGTIGYFDAVYLNLKKGTNEIRIAVSENFGGWGLKAKFENPEGLKLPK